MSLAAVNALAELARLGFEYEPISDGEVRVRCPHPEHDDEKPSASLNTEKNVWRCHVGSCGASGDIATFVAMVLGVERPIVMADLRNRYHIEDVKTLSPELVERYHGAVWEAGPLLLELRKRGITDDMIRQHRIGVCRGRITIPIRDTGGRILNIRRYLPGAPGPEKMQNTRGHGRARLYLPKQLDYKRIVICGGELKAIVTAAALNQFDIGAVSPTCGEGNWENTWSVEFRGKDVVVMLDIDEVGRAAATKLARILRPHARTVKIAELPLDPKKYPHGDVNDYIGPETATPADLLKVVDAAKEPVKPTSEKKFGTPVKVTVEQVLRAEHVRRLLLTNAVVAGYFETPFVIPRTVTVDCDRNQAGCGVCPIMLMPLNPDGASNEVTIPPTEEGLLALVGCTAKTKRGALMGALRIPTCRSVAFSERKMYTVYDVRISPKISASATTEGGEATRYPALVVGTRPESNIPYNMQGVTYPSPVDQRGVFLVSEATPAEDSIDTYSPSDAELRELTVFRPKEWTVTGLDERLKELYADLAYNVTGIFFRFDMHLAMDLCWHSALFFHLEGRLTGGWVNVIVIGDSGHGKSEAARALLGHYNLGDRVDCKNASAAGLVGGLQQIGSRWFVSWGVFPQNDKGLVVAEEAKGLSPEEFQRMTDMRSSGVAEIPKIERGRANARTRALYISNPRGSRPVANHAFGVETILQLIGAPEDVRRFEAACVVANDDVPIEEISRPKAERQQVEHAATATLSHRLVLYGWTRKPDDIVIEEDVPSALRAGAIALCGKYSEAIALVDRGTMHIKLAKLAVSLAIRTFSTAGPKVVVRRCHAEYVVRWLDDMYSSKSMGYYDFSIAKKRSEEIDQPGVVKGAILNSRHPRDVITTLLASPDITREDVEAAWDVDHDGARSIISMLIRRQCITRIRGSVYRKTNAFITFLKRLEAESIPEGTESYDDDF